ncbi:hypothetical protein LX36DRAFT_715326 [Colletotrichum falcatum]|nr:hypothetical protein LX36DRAFT_715326 [Colletotrichum falcatum]
MSTVMSQFDKNNLVKTMYEQFEVIVESNYSISEPGVTPDVKHASEMRMILALKHLLGATSQMLIGVETTIIQTHANSRQRSRTSPTIPTPMSQFHEDIRNPSMHIILSTFILETMAEPCVTTVEQISQATYKMYLGMTQVEHAMNRRYANDPNVRTPTSPGALGLRINPSVQQQQPGRIDPNQQMGQYPSPRHANAIQST